MLILLFAHLNGNSLNTSVPPGNVQSSIGFRGYSSPLADTTHLTICNNQLPYSWNGLTVLTAGVYSTTITGSNGQDSLVVLDLRVIDVGTSITNAVICNNQLPYRWNGLTLTNSGTYSVTLTSANGCDSVPILSLTVNDVVTSTTNETICSNQVPFIWNGNSYTVTGSYNVVLTSTANCDSIATLNLVVKPTSESFTTITTCSNQLPVNWNGFSYTQAGNYSVTLPGANGCDSVAHLNLIVNRTVSHTSRDTVCTNQLPYIWNGRNLTTSGTYREFLTTVSGCDSVVNLFLIVIPPALSQTNITICPAQLPYSWNGNSYSAGGHYTVSLNSSRGCDSTARLRLTVTDILRDTVHRVVCITELPFVWNGNSYTVPGMYSANFVTAAGCDSVAVLDLSLDNLSVLPDSVEICPEELPFSYHGHIFNTGGIYPISPPIVLDACHSINLLNLVVQTVIPGRTEATVCSNDLPYIWNGNQYDSAGTYTLSLTSEAGCDSLAILELTVPGSANVDSYVSHCADQLPYVWNGVQYFETGLYIDTLRGSTGCDSIVNLHLQVLPAPRDTAVVNICPLQLPYSWEGLTLNSSGFYQVTFVSNARCDSVKVINLRVNAIIRTSFDTIVCGNALPFIWNGQPYTLSGSYSDTLQNVAGCDSIATLNLTVNNDLESLTEVTTCVSQLPFFWNGNNYNSSGTYAATLVNSAGCDSVARLNLSVVDQLSSESTITICNNQLPYSWNGNSYAVAGNYVVNLTSSSGCDSLAILHLIVTDILTSTTNVTVCPAQLPFSWNGNLYSGEGTYAVTLSTPNGCDSVPILSLTVAPFVTSITEVSVCENQLPFSWNGEIFNSGGEHTVNLTTTAGCDSIATLHLTVLLNDTLTTAAAVCENLLPYSWNGSTFTGPGTYYKVFTSSSGCDSVEILHLTVHAVDTSETQISICRVELPYSWNGQTYTAGGQYFSNLTSQSGCDSVAILTLLVNEPSLTDLDISICNLQLPYNWNGQVLTAGGNYADTLINAAGCDSIVRLHLNVSPEIITRLNISICQNDLPFAWNGQLLNAAGDYSANFTSQAGCDSTVRLTLSVNEVLTSVTDLVLCRNALPYTWNGLSISSAGTYNANLTSSAGCDSIARLNLSINDISITTQNATICSADLPYAWNGSNLTVTGVYRDTLQNNSGCDSVITLNLVVNSSPGPVTVPPALEYCQFEMAAPLSATSDSGQVLQWYTSATGGQPSSVPPTPSTQTTGTFTFYVSQKSQVCEGPRSSITVTVNRKPDLGPDRSVAVCFGETASLSGLYDVAGLTANWTFAGVPVSPAIISLPGLYTLVAGTSAGCADTAEVNFTINPPVTAYAGEDADVETNVPYRLQGSGNGSFQWSPTNLVSNPTIANPLVTVSSNATLYLTVTDNLGCMASDTVNLRVLNGPTFYVPSAFTPNGDGLNDIFRPTPVGIHKLDFFRVYNRYGELVYETSEIGKGWNGIYKGIQQNGGNYVWALKGVDRKGRERIMKGNVVLIR